MGQGLLRQTRKFFSATDGGIAIAFALALPMFISAAGVAVDLAQAYNVKMRLTAALDKAALAAGNMSGTQEEIEERVLDFVDANYGEDKPGSPFDISVEIDDDGIVTVSASSRVNTYFMGVFGTDYIDIEAVSQVIREAGSLEVSLVLDLTGSMAGQRIIDLREAANELVGIILEEQSPPYYRKIALIPYSMAVNVGSTYAAAIRGSYTNNTCQQPTAPTCRYYRFRRASDNNYTTHEISNCVSERAGVLAYTDDPPSTTLMGKVFPAPGTYNPCLSSAIVPLTTDEALLNTRINAMQAGGSTGGHIGVAWGWYMVSPNFGYLWPADSRPAPYGTERLIKVVVIMTDGEYNSVYYNGVIARDSISGSGSNAYHINTNSHNGGSYAQAELLCDAMKDEDILVYTVGLDVANTPAARAFVENCATDPSYVYLPANGVEMRTAFRDIARQISMLRVAQ